ncbi:MAG: lamin tail domain-containing protein [Verrucomicrobiales bacterium]
MPEADIALSPGWLENGQDAVALYLDAAANFPIGTVPTSNNLVDAVVYDTNDADDNNLLTILSPGTPQLDENGNLAKDTESIQRFPDGQPFNTNRYLAAPTPGIRNNPQGELNVFLSANTISESAAGTITVTLNQDGDPDSPVVVSVESSDPSELDVPAQVTIPAGVGGNLEFEISPIDDGAADGNQMVTLEFSADGFFPVTVNITVEDDGDTATIVINEVNAEVEEGRDANQDGVTGFTQDEFIEIVNVSGAPIDLSGWTINDAVGMIHTFPANTVLSADCALVVFGGGGVLEGYNALFGNALIQKASTGQLSLNDTGDQIAVRDTGGVERAGFVYGDIDGQDGSRVRDPDISGTVFVGHTALSVLPWSPGTRTSGQSFCPPEDALTLTVVGDTAFAENAGAAASRLRVARNGDLGTEVMVSLNISDASELAVPATVTIPVGEPFVEFDIDAVDDPFIDGNQTVLVLASAGPGFTSSTAFITVQDDGADTASIVINEVDVDSPGPDTAEFIELYDGGLGNTPLDGYVVVLFNGSNGAGSDNESYTSFDLDGFATNADGYFVIGTLGVPNLDLGVFPFSGGWIVNSGTRAVALYLGNAGDFPDGSAALPAGIVDAVVYGSGAEANILGLAFGTGETSVSKDSESRTIARLPDGGAVLDFSLYGSGVPTPGAANSGDLPPASAYPAWAANYPGVGGPGANDDTDTLLNAIEFGLGLDPFAADVSPIQLAVNAGGNLQISVAKGAEAGADPTTAFFASVSFDGIEWSDTDINVITNDATTFTAEYTGDEPTVMMRVGVRVAAP